MAKESVIDICNKMKIVCPSCGWAGKIRSAHLAEVAELLKKLTAAEAEVARLKFECHKCFENGETRHAREVVE